MNRLKFLLHSASFGLLMWLAWTPKPFVPLLFIAFIPLLFIEENLTKKYTHTGAKIFGWAYLSFLFWNVLTTWWVGNTYTGEGDYSGLLAGLFVNSANSLLMCIPFMLFHFTKKRLGDVAGYISLPSFWLAFEYFHFQWELSWPWLTIGFGLSQYPVLFQWYEYTGVLGGSLWIITVNILLFRYFLSVENQLRLNIKNKIIICALVILIPVTLSYFIGTKYAHHSSDRTKYKEIVVVQPNIDPYNIKFDFTTLDNQLKTLLQLSAPKVGSATDYLVWPETAIPQGIWINEIDSNESIIEVRDFLKKYPRLKLVTGISAYQQYISAETPTARYFSRGECCYDAFNSAIQLDSTNRIQIYHKSKLVPGVERMPYPGVLKFLERFALDMGGITGSLGTQEHRTVFFSDDSVGIAPVICYESIYGGYCGEYVRKGADYFFIMTNDGWWGNTAGHLQHLHYASVLAVEMRRCIARSANTGTSCFIDEQGNISDETQWWTPTVIKKRMPVNSQMTFYSNHGDYLGVMAYIVAVILLIWMMTKKILRK